MPLASGTRLGPYEVIAPLGAGGMGEVYRARDLRLRREVALKVLPAHLAHDAARRQRFEQEARAVAALNHPNIVAVYDVGDNYFVEELVAGVTLRVDEPIAVRRAIDLAVQVANGLAAAHARGITHRDLKPANIMVANDGHAKILDFGLAKVAEAFPGMDASTQTFDGTVLGTVGYMSPEQVRGRPADPRSDIFSFGVVLFEMLSGKRAFEGASGVEVMSAILKEEPAELPDHVAPALRQIVQHCLEKAPEKRFQSARDLAFALQSLSGSMVQPALVKPKATTQRRIGPALAALAIVAALAAGFWMGRAGSPHNPPAFKRLTFQRGFVSGARFAPDGRTVGYSASWNGNPSEIYSAPVDSPEARPLGLPGAHLFAISAAGEMAIGLDAVLGAVPGMGPRGTLARVSLSGGAPRILLTDVEDADWEPHGERMAVAHVVNGLTRLEYPIGHVLYQSTGWIDSIRISPSGERIAFGDHPLRNDDRGSVAVVDLAGKKTVLASGWETLDGVGWAPDGKSLWFVGNTQGTSDTVWSVTMSGKLRVLMRSPTGCFLRDISPDGRVLIDSLVSRNEMVWRGEGESTERSLTWLTDSFPADLSRDGKTLLFTEPALGTNYYVCVRRTDGSPVERLGEGEAESLSSDGKWALATLLTSSQQLLLIPTGVGEVQHLPRVGLAYQRFAQWLPDSQSIMFAASEAGHGTRLWTQRVFPPGQPRAFTGEGMSLRGNSVSPDGKRVAAIGPPGKLALYPVDGGEARAVPGVDAEEQLIRWSADGRQIFTYTPNRMPAILYKVDLATGKKEKWGEFRPTDPAGATYVYAILLTAGGKSGVYSFQRTESSLKLTEGLR